MEKIDLRSLEEILGVYSPWSIRSVKTNESDRTIEVFLESVEKSRLFGLLPQSRSPEEGILGSWQYMSLGQYRVVIRAPKSGAAARGAGLSYSILSQPCFLGSSDRRYSNLLRQQVARCQATGLNPAQISEVLGLTAPMVATVLGDLAAIPSQLQSLACLPSELDPVWERLLRGELSIQTHMLPLKLLLNKLQLGARSCRRRLDLLPSAMEIRRFFLANASVLDGEINRLFAVKSQSANGFPQYGEPVTKLVLPGLVNPVWQELLAGRIPLNSRNVGLNLLISRQATIYVKAHTSHEKLTAVEIVRDYFHKNYRGLKAELLLLNRACSIHDKAKYRLPEVDHLIWQQILQDDTFIPSNHIAYKLLLTRLRSQLKQESSATSRLEAARRVREFIRQNHKAMKQELVYLIKQTATAA